ncbi:MAG: hypothetical protein J4G10_00680 [Alphaproteobacteria bacterium]|nr:hypothetical protein [Alphaproteobacteria bacterium]
MNRRSVFLLCLLCLLPAALAGCQKGMTPAGAQGSTAPPPATAALPTPGELVGLDKEGVQALLGAPQLIRRDGPAEVWQYTANACILDLFLYEAGGAYQVEYLELRTQPDENFPQKRCYEQFRKDKEAARLG